MSLSQVFLTVLAWPTKAANLALTFVVPRSNILLATAWSQLLYTAARAITGGQPPRIAFKRFATHAHRWEDTFPELTSRNARRPRIPQRLTRSLCTLSIHFPIHTIFGSFVRPFGLFSRHIYHQTLAAEPEMIRDQNWSSNWFQSSTLRLSRRRWSSNQAF